MIDTNTSVINTSVVEYKGKKIYLSEIQELENEYISSLMDSSDIYKSSCFFGLLNFLHIRLFKWIVKIENDDYVLLDPLFYDIYLPLCSKYNITPTLINFCVMTGVSKGNLYNALNDYGNTGKKINSDDQLIIKNWLAMCESALYSRAVEHNSIGAIFGLKAVHGYQEQAQRLEIVGAAASATPEQIAEKYNVTGIPGRPAPPELELINNSSGEMQEESREESEEEQKINNL